MSPYRHLVSLGSSFAAGPGIEPVVHRSAGRSGRNYAHLVADALGARITDLSVSGATTATILEQPQRMGLRSFPPQLTLLPPDADLITLTAGGNDLNYVGSLLKRAMIGSLHGNRWLGPVARRFPTPQLTRLSAADVQRTADGLAQVIDAARNRAADARVVLVDYLTILGADTEPGRDVPLDGPTLERFKTIGVELSRAFEVASATTGVDLVRASAISASHALGSAEPWVSALAMRPGRLASSFHPNASGMRAVADAVLSVVGR